MSTIGSSSTKSTPKSTPLSVETSAVSKTPKVRELDLYDEARNKLRLYLMQCTVYIEFNKNKFKAKAEEIL